MLRVERRRVLRHQREAHEIEQAYEKIKSRDFQGDTDLDHAIEEDRRRYRWVDSPVDKHFDSSDDESYYGAVAYHHPEPIVAAPVVH